MTKYINEYWAIYVLFLGFLVGAWFISLINRLNDFSFGLLCLALALIFLIISPIEEFEKNPKTSLNP